MNILGIADVLSRLDGDRIAGLLDGIDEEKIDKKLSAFSEQLAAHIGAEMSIVLESFKEEMKK